MVGLRLRFQAAPAIGITRPHASGSVGNAWDHCGRQSLRCGLLGHPTGGAAKAAVCQAVLERSPGAAPASIRLAPLAGLRCHGVRLAVLHLGFPNASPLYLPARLSPFTEVGRRMGAPHPAGTDSDPSPSHEAGIDVTGQPWRCAACQSPVADGADRLRSGTDGSFVNPHGYVHDLVAVLQAPGVVALGLPVTDHCWFNGYAWRVALCRVCAAHLGWVYDAMSDAQPPQFVGLRRVSISNIV